MSISYPLALPTGVKGIQQIHLKGNSVTALSQSPFTLSQQVQVFPGQQWTADVTLATLTRADAEVWNAFLLSLNGYQGTFLLGDPAGVNPRGVGTGTPLVNGGTQSGNELVTDGWSDSITNILKAGDWFHMVVNSRYRLHKVLQNTNSDGSGNATLTIWPSLRESPPDNTSLVINNAQGQFRLSAPATDWSITPEPAYTISFSAMEAL